MVDIRRETYETHSKKAIVDSDKIMWLNEENI